MHLEHAEAMFDSRQEKYRSAINFNKPVHISTIADAIALTGLLNAMLQGMSITGVDAETREDFETPLRGYLG